ncbi:Uncharacterised protein [Citrobacter koseri]|nr:Uncharacterised protein [Citrobacter koseri]
MADTDNEHAITVEYARTIHKQIGCKPVQFAKRIYTEDDLQSVGHICKRTGLSVR